MLYSIASSDIGIQNFLGSNFQSWSYDLTTLLITANTNIHCAKKTQWCWYYCLQKSQKWSYKTAIPISQYTFLLHNCTPPHPLSLLSVKQSALHNTLLIYIRTSSHHLTLSMYINTYFWCHVRGTNVSLIFTYFPSYLQNSTNQGSVNWTCCEITARFQWIGDCSSNHLY